MKINIINFVQKIVYLMEKNNVAIEDYDLIRYGLTIFIRYLILIVTIFTLSIFLNIFIKTLIFNLFFIGLRIYTGGYHSKNAISCFIISLLITIGIPYLLKNLTLTDLQIILLLITSVFILLNIKIESNSNKLIDEYENLIYKKKMKILISIYSLILVILLFLSFKNLAQLLLFSIIVNSISVLIEKFKMKGEL